MRTPALRRCTPCGDLLGVGHASWDRTCPTFLRKCREQDRTHPQNALPFFPSTAEWTWRTETPFVPTDTNYMNTETVSSGTRDRRGEQTQLMFKKMERFRCEAEDKRQEDRRAATSAFEAGRAAGRAASLAATLATAGAVAPSTSNATPGPMPRSKPLSSSSVSFA